MIDLYCERLNSGFWAEPINALSNIVFLFSAWFCWRLARKRDSLNGSSVSLIALIAAIGIGSFVFHTLATPWAMVLDLVFILLFQLTFFWLYSRKIIQLKPGRAALLLALFLSTIVLGKIFPEYINGSLMYVPTLLLLAGLGLFHYLRHKKERVLLLSASALFLLSFLFRTLDNNLCPQFPIGTHFLWHLSCGLIVYLLGRALIVNMPKTEKIV